MRNTETGAVSRIGAAIVAVAMAAVLALGASTPALAASGTWRGGSGAWWFEYDRGGYASSGWESVNGTWYLFDDAGWMRTGWVYTGGAWYYLGGDGAMRTGWAQVGGTWYYLKASGAMATGWQYVGNAWYYLNASGAMQTGWQYLGGTWYYLNPGSGAMATGWKLIGSTWYYMNGSGAMQTGWQYVGGDWYFLKSSGAMAANTWVGDYYVDGSGRMLKNQWVNGYYVGSDGAWVPSAGTNPGNTGNQGSNSGDNDNNYVATYRVDFELENAFCLKPESAGNGVWIYPQARLSTQYVKAGKDATPPTDIPFSKGYYLKGWDKSYKNIQQRTVITAIVGDEYEDWRAQWIKQNLTSGMSTYDKVVKLIDMISEYSYSTSSSSGRGLYFNESGDCYAGNLMLYDFCQDLGIPCVFQNAMTMQRWYSVNFGGVGNHHNDIVWIDGKQYLADATPGYGMLDEYDPASWNPDAYAIIHGTMSLSKGPQNREPSLANSYYTGCAYVTCGLTKNQFTVEADKLETPYVNGTALCFEAFCSQIVSITSSNQSVMKNGDAGNNYISNESADEQLGTPPYGRAALLFEGTGTTTITVKTRGVYGVDNGKESTFTYTVTYQ